MHRFGNRLIEIWLTVFHLESGCIWRDRDFDGENRALARPRADAHPVVEQIAQALHDREPQTKAAAAFARGVVELMVFVEDRLKFFAGNTDAGIPNLDAQHVSAAEATK